MTIDLVAPTNIELNPQYVGDTLYLTNLPETDQLKSIVDEIVGRMETAAVEGTIHIYTDIEVGDTSHLAAVAAAAYGLPYK